MAARDNEEIIAELGLRRERPWSIYDYPNLIRTASVLCFLALWEFYGRRTDPLLLSYPTAVVWAAFQLIHSGELPRQLLESLTTLGIGFGISVVFGVALGLVMGRSPIAVLIRIGKKANRKMITAFTVKPRPNHIMKSGVRATCGVA